MQSIKSAFLFFTLLASPLFAEAPFKAADGLFDTSDLKSLGLKTIKGKHTQLYFATEDGYKFCHHPNLVEYRGRLYCMWSNGKMSEDKPGQRILYCNTADGKHWTKPTELANDKDGKGICVASGFRVVGEQLIAFYTVTGGTNFNPATALVARTSKDGQSWSQPKRITSGFFIEAPRPIHATQLLLGGEFVGDSRSTKRARLLYTSDASGMSGWKESTIQIANPKNFGYSEPSFFTQSDKTLVVTLRNYSVFLYGSRSTDGGKTWSNPTQTNFPDTTARTSAGNLPDGTAYLINNSLPKRLERGLLSIALSKDGKTFDRAFVLRNEPTKKRYDGEHKRDGWQYPNATIWKGKFYVAYSINKEDVAITQIELSELVE
ncbi:MAG: hypothetical protein CMJ78_20580 [Planctomycetaceae bacterium]|nr:hypothetical protein [Planctomycetaceae bacterium]